MKSHILSLLVLFSFALVQNAWAQEPEDIITEAEDDIVTEASDSTLDFKIIDGVVGQNLIYESRLLPYAPLREADVPWQRKMWRIIDSREKLNAPFRYPPQPFVKILIDGVASGDIVPFRLDDFKEQSTKEEIDNKLFRIDTARTVDPLTYETKIVVTKSDLDPMAIERFRIKEIWYFDEADARMKSRILGIAPILAEFDDAGNFKYEGPMFWIYYPQARAYFSKHRAFVEDNDAAPLTWEMLFETRMFSSYIIKASNVYDNRLEDYASLKENPVDRLYESENIKMELFNFEHDLWSW